MRLINLMLVGAVVFLVGCASEKRRFAAAEEKLGTDGPITSLYHAAVYYPSEVSPKFDGYLVGVEKVARSVLGTGDAEKVEKNQARLRDSELKPASKLDDGKLMMVTHVVKTHRDVSAHRNCFVFNAYNIDESARKTQIAPECPSTPRVWDPAQAYSNSWEGMNLLEASLAEALKEPLSPGYPMGEKKYTHLLVVVLGWNTVQEEAVRNMNSIALNLIAARREQPRAQRTTSGRSVDRFRPLVIGMTWPSQWNSKWADPAIKLLSFGTKADDADEVGITWLGTLLHRTIPNARTKASSAAKLVVVGHSFGSRAVTVAACAGPGILPHKEDAPISLAKVDVVVNLQGAFMAKRIFGAKEDGLRFQNRCSHVERFVLTASSHDGAVRGAIWGRIYGEYVGDSRSYSEYCGRKNPEINCGTASADGRVAVQRSEGSKIYYISADDLISENAFETGGRGHSDIYRVEHGRLIGSAIDGFVSETRP
ncbi:hypothetical protein LJR290_005977 [Variovorax sp. LjRoot290]|uniref:hypothetical protein n=1 Tax=Variovorax sp. LjRoot290 TaxID=3342316 RepID=UPI003ECD54B0